ncbi:hypothetical protein PITC_045430 [Penicillium italicum]|uniref:Uncharacterized protein n=1 Tax=Penicillium italicum TaxID=40296 RepID=A0A0A2KRY8_PENIT|nr:hypothetical protein PITC_045430 [Penicillium italicum]
MRKIFLLILVAAKRDSKQQNLTNGISCQTVECDIENNEPPKVVNGVAGDETLPSSFADLPELTEPDTSVSTAEISAMMMEDINGIFPTPISSVDIVGTHTQSSSLVAQCNIPEISWLETTEMTQEIPLLQPNHADCFVGDDNHDGDNSAAMDSNERRLTKVVALVEESGFESVDELVTEYYTLQVGDAELASAQSHSRSRNLRPFLQALHESSKQWSVRESSSYKEGILRAAEELLCDEIKTSLSELDKTQTGGRSESFLWRNVGEPILSLINSPTENGALISFMKRDMTRLRNNASAFSFVLSS